MYILNKKGFTLTEITVAAGLSAMVMIGSSYLISHAYDVQKNEEQMYWLEERRNEMITAVQNDLDWEKINSLNLDMGCAEASGGCRAFTEPQKMVLKIASQTLEGTNPALGLSKKGDFCYQFDEVNGHPDCVVGVSLTWKALCVNASCIKPQFKIEISFQHKPSGKYAVKNLHHFNVSLFSDSKTQILYDMCYSMGGTLIGTNCQIAALNTSCDPGNASGTGATYAMGFDARGAVICGQPVVSNCPANEFLTGFNGDGSSICAPGCAVAPPSPSGPSLPVVPAIPTTPVNCVGDWNSCNPSTCDTNGTQTFVITVPASNGGTACTFNNGQTKPCTNSPCYTGCTVAACFVAGTPVLMGDGKYKAIEAIQAGDQVVSYDEHKQIQRIDKVAQPMTHEKKWQRLHHFELADGTQFTSTSNHPFYVVEKDYWFEAGEILSMIKAGQSLSLLNVKNESNLIKKLYVEHKKVPVYNLEVQGISSFDEKYGKWGRGHNYYVNGVLTHNKYAPRSCDASDPSCDPCPGANNHVDETGSCRSCPAGKVFTIQNGGRCCFEN